MFDVSVFASHLSPKIFEILFLSLSDRPVHSSLSVSRSISSQLSRHSLQSWPLTDFYSRNSLETIRKTDNCWHRDYHVNGNDKGVNKEQKQASYKSSQAQEKKSRERKDDKTPDLRPQTLPDPSMAT